MPENKRILMLLENNPYPNDVRVRNEANSLTKAGYDVTVICPRKKTQPAYEDVQGVRVYRYPPPIDGDGLLGYFIEYGYSLITAAWLSLVVLFRHGFDVIHAHNPPDVLVLVAMLYKPFGKRFVFDHHDLSPELYYYARFNGEGSNLVYRVLVFFEVLSCRIADRVIATNESYKNKEIERANVKPEHIYVVRNGPQEDWIEAKATPAKPNDVPVVGYLGVIGYQDNVDVLVKAVHHLVYDLSLENFRCVIAGGGDALDHVRAAAAELKVADRIEFLGWVKHTDVPEILSGFDICVAPELSNVYADQSTVIKMMEYMTFSKPIVSFDLPEHRRSAGDAALYARDNAPMELAKHIATLLNSPEKRREMGAVGRKRIETLLSWSHQESQLLQLYEGLFKQQ